MSVSTDKDVTANTDFVDKYLFLKNMEKTASEFIYSIGGKWHNQELVELDNTLWVICSEFLNSGWGSSFKGKIFTRNNQ